MPRKPNPLEDRSISTKLNREYRTRLEEYISRRPGLDKSKVLRIATMRFLDMEEWWRPKPVCQTVECPFYRDRPTKTA